MRDELDRRERASTPLVFAVLGFLFVAVVVVVWRFNDFGPVPSELLYPFAALVVVLVLVLGAGLYPWLRPLHYVSVDTGADTATFVRGGAVVRRVPVSEVGPLREAVDIQNVRSGKSWRTATFHVARSDPFPELFLSESEDELKTRQTLESCSRAWKVGYVKASGEVRKPEDVDVPLFQRLGGDETATKPLPQRQGSNLTVEWKDGGHVISTSYRPKIDRTKTVVAFLAPLAVVWFFLRDPVLSAFRAGTPMPSRLAGLGVVLVALVPGLFVAAKAWLRLHRPPSIRISADGVRFRLRSLPLKSIEEIERIAGGACRLVSDDRFVTIDADFCEPSEREWLHHELRRLVIEAGQSSPVV